MSEWVTHFYHLYPIILDTAENRVGVYLTRKGRRRNPQLCAKYWGWLNKYRNVDKILFKFKPPAPHILDEYIYICIHNIESAFGQSCLLSLLGCVYLGDVLFVYFDYRSQCDLYVLLVFTPTFQESTLNLYNCQVKLIEGLCTCGGNSEFGQQMWIRRRPCCQSSSSCPEIQKSIVK